MKNTLRAVLGSLAVLALAAAPLAAQMVQYGAGSPQELIQRLEKAAKANDLAEMVRCMEPEGRNAMAAMMTIMPVMMLAFGAMAGEMAEGMADALDGEEQGAAAAVDQEMASFKNDFVALLAKYGVGDPFEEEGEDAFDPETAFANLDAGAYIADIMSFMNERFPGDSGMPMPFEGSDVAITGLEITGDRAIATAGDDTLTMVRVDGRWYLEGPADEPADLG